MITYRLNKLHCKQVRHAIGLRLLNILTAVDGHQLLGSALWSVTDGPNLTFSQSSNGGRGWGSENILSEWWLFQGLETRETRPATHTLSAEPAVACQTCHPCARQTLQAKLSQQDTAGHQLYRIEREVRFTKLFLKCWFIAFQCRLQYYGFMFCSWAGCRETDCSTVDSASWIVSKIQEDICFIDRNVVAWWLTKRRKIDSGCMHVSLHGSGDSITPQEMALSSYRCTLYINPMNHDQENRKFILSATDRWQNDFRSIEPETKMLNCFNWLNKRSIRSLKLLCEKKKKKKNQEDDVRVAYQYWLKKNPYHAFLI